MATIVYSFCRKITLSKHTHSVHGSGSGSSQYAYDFGSRSGSSAGSLKEIKMDEMDELESDTEIVFGDQRPLDTCQSARGWPAPELPRSMFGSFHQNQAGNASSPSQPQPTLDLNQNTIPVTRRAPASPEKEYIISAAPLSLSSSFGSSQLGLDIRSESQEIIESLPMVDFEHPPRISKRQPLATPSLY